jgi:hypothetical protein
MSYTVELPDDLYQRVERYAAERQRRPKSLIVSWVTDAIQWAEAPTPTAGSGLSTDELLTLLAGNLSVPDADAGDVHDRYFGSKE